MNNTFFACLTLLLAAYIFVGNNNAYAGPMIKSDEKIIFFPTSAYLSKDKAKWNIPIHGWVFEPADSFARSKAIELALRSKYDLKTTKQNEHIFKSRVNLLLADNERDKQVSVKIAGQVFQLAPSAENGHFIDLVTIGREAVAEYENSGELGYEAVLAPKDRRKFQGRVLLVQPRGISVISDIDDTVKLSSVTERRALISKTFYEEFEAVEGVANYFQKLKKDKQATFHFVSSSPWHLFEPLLDFMTANSFPSAEFLLKNFRFKDSSLLNLFKKGTLTKPPLIRSILSRYPERKFILIGDSGEQDPEVYAQIMREFPEQIISCKIRYIPGSDPTGVRFKQTFNGIAQEKWHIFSDASELLGN